MKRTGFKPKHAPRPVKRMDDYTVKPRAVAVAVADTRARMVVPVPKAAPLRDESYRRWVASLPCAHCRVEGYSNAAHGDEGKGLSIKSSDETCYPLCVDRPGVRGCHTIIGASGSMPREDRRLLEIRYAQQTRMLWDERGTAHLTTGYPQCTFRATREP